MESARCVTRLSRKVLIGMGCVSAFAIAGALGYALQTRTKAPATQELLSTQSAPAAEGLAGLPKDYTGLPHPPPPLGPPLPGDLGKPILSAGTASNTVAPGMGRDPEAQRARARDGGGPRQPSLHADRATEADLRRCRSNSCACGRGRDPDVTGGR